MAEIETLEKPRVFLSYAREHSAAAQALAWHLEGAGYAVWRDRTIPAGKTFHQVIEEQLAAAQCVIVLWSKAALDSDWVLAKAKEARQRRCRHARQHFLFRTRSSARALQ